jgi:hypothetical protein
VDALRNRHTPGAWASALAGGLAAAVGLAATELAAAWNRRVPSVIVAVGDLVIEYAPESMARPAIRGLGSDSKPALLVAIVVVAVVAGAALGAAGGRRRWVPAAGFVVLGLLGASAGAREPFASPVLVVAAAFVAAELAAAAFLLLRAALIAPPAEPGATPTGSNARLLERRRFLGLTSAVVAAAGVSMLLSRVLRERLSASAARAAVRLPTPTSAATSPVPAARLRVPGLTSLVTPNDRFYRVDTSLLVPQVEPDDWRL